jgi:uncharacterized membrane protein (UPF0127 family)
VCESVNVADSTLRRMRGLLGRRALPRGEGIVLRPAWSIHTAFMHFSIDVVFLDAEQVVMRVEHGLRPFKTASCRGAREVVELAAGECERRGLVVGDRIAWASRNVLVTIPGAGIATEPAETRGTVLIASGDQRFVKLARYHLEGRSFAVADEPVAAALASDSFADSDVDAVLLDGSTSLSDGLRGLNAIRVNHPELPAVLVVESSGGRSFDTVRVYDKWQETEAAIDAVEQAVVETQA